MKLCRLHDRSPSEPLFEISEAAEPHGSRATAPRTLTLVAEEESLKIIVVGKDGTPLSTHVIFGTGANGALAHHFSMPGVTTPDRRAIQALHLEARAGT